MKRFEKKYGKGNVVVNGRTNGGDPVVDIYSKSINDSKVNEASERFLKSAGEILANQMQGKSAGYDTLMNRLNSMPLAKKLKDNDLEKVVEYAMKEMGLKEGKVNEAKKFKPGDMWSNDFDYDGMLKYALTVNHKTPLKTLNKLHASATDVNYHTPFSGLGNAIDWITDDGANSSKGKDFMKQFHNDIKDEIKSNA